VLNSSQIRPAEGNHFDVDNGAILVPANDDDKLRIVERW